MAERSLQHREPDSKDDETLRREARVHLASEPALQLVAELIARLRELDLPWWTPVKLRERWGAVERMGWFRERSDIRQQITTSLTGLSPRAARRKTPDFQGALIDSVIDEGDITPRAFEAAFDPRDLAVYGPAGAYWHFFRESMPWDQDTPGHQEIVAWLLKALLADRSPFEGIGRTPILTPWDVRTAIDGRLWQTRIPLEIRVAIDNARLKQERERPGVPFHADGELAIAGPDIIAANIPPREILPVVQLAQKAMRFDPPRAAQKAEAPKPAAAELSSGRSAAGTAATPGGAAATPAAAAASVGTPAPAASAPAAAATPASSGGAPVSSGGAPVSAPAGSAPVVSGGALDVASAGKPAAGGTPASAPSGAAGAPPGGASAAVSGPPSASSPISVAPRSAGNLTPPPGAVAAAPSAIAARPASSAGAPGAAAAPSIAEPARTRLPSDPGITSPSRVSAPPPPPAPSAPRASTPPSAPAAARPSTPPAPPAAAAARPSALPTTPPAPGAAPAAGAIESLDDIEEEDNDGVQSERTSPWAVSASEQADVDLDDLGDLGPSDGAKPSAKP
ncbi:hypothetical protein SOCE26_024790 [Sorangium cellulosum]|uniref:Uncharacterized protein n=1 Tax=Sorangium cellulosum TaxID=56 RepID=A0A2L0EP42_SORCE|nr:hypothetical protein [Sorangium cellulosum]AUX41074.1 hypothetical protein SOCE26_024790 [Sorangium cellulosum]